MKDGQYAYINLRYRGSNQIMIYIDCNHIKGSFEKVKIHFKICIQVL